MNISSVSLNAADYVILAIIVLFSLLGFKKGLFKSTVGILSLVASLILAWILYPIVSDILMGMGFRDFIYGIVYKQLEAKAVMQNEIAALPQFFKSTAESGIIAALDNVSSDSATFIIEVTSFISVLILARIIIYIFVKLMKIISNMPIIGTFDKISGLFLGIIKGILVVSVISLAIYAIIPISGNNKIYTQTKNSYILNKTGMQDMLTNAICNRSNIPIKNGE